MVCYVRLRQDQGDEGKYTDARYRTATQRSGYGRRGLRNRSTSDGTRRGQRKARESIQVAFPGRCSRWLCVDRRLQACTVSVFGECFSAPNEPNQQETAANAVTGYGAPGWFNFLPAGFYLQSSPRGDEPCTPGLGNALKERSSDWARLTSTGVLQVSVRSPKRYSSTIPPATPS